MSFDFFGEGIAKEPEVQFTKEENMFLQSKLPFLDPKKTQQISIGSALQFLKFSGIRSEGIQKILKNCRVEMGKKFISYDDMKKIFRGVALAQADEEPSTVNITANIKLKMPIFYDDQSDDDDGPVNQPPVREQPLAKAQEQKPPAQEKMPEINVQKPTQDSVKQPLQPLQQQKPINDKAALFSFEAPVKPVQMPPQPINTPTFPPQLAQKPKEKESALTIKLRQFESRWGKLKTDGKKIDGGEVKTLCKNLGQRSNLSKAWKLCCHTYSGALTKGEFFVFLEIVASPEIPENLTQQMKQCISLLDHPSNPAMKESNHFARVSSISQPPTVNKMASSQLFQNFGKAESSVQNRPRVKTQQNIDQTPKRLKQTKTKFQEVSKITQDHKNELTDLRRGQQTMNNIFGEVQQFLTAVNNRNNDIKTQIEELKQGQTNLNQRLNKVCFSMNSIIVNQNTIIEQLISEFANQNNQNQQRVGFLENHITQLNQQLQQKQILINKIVNRAENANQSPMIQKHQQSVPPQPIATHKPQEQEHQQPSGQKQKHKEEPGQTKNVQSPSKSISPEFSKSPSAQQQLQPSPNQEFNSPQNIKQKQQEIKPSPQQLQFQQRMKMKRAQVIQLIMHLTPLTPEEEPALIQRISEYNQEELNTVYYNCYQKLRAKQQMEAERLAQQTAAKISKQTFDQFASSNFHGHQASPQDMFQ